MVLVQQQVPCAGLEPRREKLHPLCLARGFPGPLCHPQLCSAVLYTLLLGSQRGEVPPAAISLSKLPGTEGELWSLLVSEGKGRGESYLQAGEKEQREPSGEPAPIPLGCSR